MTTQRLDLHTPKIEALRGTFEGHFRTTLFQGLPDGTVRQLLERAGTGYVEGHIHAAWNGFQWGGDHVRTLVQEELYQLDDDYKPAEVRKVGAEPAIPAERRSRRRFPLPLDEWRGHRLVAASIR